MFCSCFELFILAGFQQTMGYHLLFIQIWAEDA